MVVINFFLLLFRFKVRKEGVLVVRDLDRGTKLFVIRTGSVYGEVRRILFVFVGRVWDFIFYF